MICNPCKTYPHPADTCHYPASCTCQHKRREDTTP